MSIFGTILGSTIVQQVARLALTSPAAAQLLLPAGVRPLVQQLQQLPEMRQQLADQWARHNNVVESDWSKLTPAQSASLKARVDQQRALLDSSQAALSKIDGYIAQARGILSGIGIPVPAVPGLGALPAIGIAIIIVAAAIGGAVLLATFATFSRDLAAAGRVGLGIDPAPQPGATIQNAGIGVGALLIGAAVLLLIMKGGKR